MKREDRQMLLIYVLIFAIIVLLIVLTKVIVDSVKEEKPAKPKKVVQKVVESPYPNVNDECTFNVTMIEYGNLSMAGCEGGYTRYNISDVKVDDTLLNVSIIYSDKNQVKTGLFINDKKVKSSIDNVSNLKFGVFDNKLFVLDKSDNDVNVLSFNSNGKEVYNLQTVLAKEKINDLSTGDTSINSKMLNPDNFVFGDGFIEFDAVTGKCENGEKTKGSHYKVVYSDEKFEIPEFVQLINC